MGQEKDKFSHFAKHKLLKKDILLQLSTSPQVGVL